MSASDGSKPLDVQIGGDHYKSMAIQPMEYSMANKLDACQHTIIKYVTRFRDKGGIQDLEKAKHCIEMLIHFELQNSERMQAIGQNGEMEEEVYAAVARSAWANCELESLTSEGRKYARDDMNGFFWSERGRKFNMNRWRVLRWIK